MTTSRRIPVSRLGAMYVLFVLSGAAALVYEVVWARQLVLVFGNTSQAVSAILTGFFGGLAIGSVVGGRIADRIARPLRFYGILEVVLVGVVLVTPLTFALIGAVYGGAYDALAETPGALALVRFVLAVLALGPATVLMGATLPALTRFLSGTELGFGGAFGRLYAVNTIGAIVGTAIAGFLLIELFGLTGALVLGAAGSATAGVLAILLDRSLGDRAVVAPATARAIDHPVPDRPANGPAWETMPRLALLLAFVSGLTSLGYQVVWNRMLSAGTGHSTYVFTTILVLFLVGIAVGALLLDRIRPRLRSILGLIALAQVAAAAFVLVGAWAVLSQPTRPFLPAGEGFIGALGLFVLSSALVVLPATIALGMVFPATASLMGSERGHEGASSGRLLAVNTVGAILATFILPFFVIPLIGSPATLALLAITNAAIGAALVLPARGVPALNRTVTGGLGGVLVVVIVVGLVTGTAFRSPAVAVIEAVGGQIYESTEDEIATVEAGEIGGNQLLWVGGTGMTIKTVDTKFMVLLPLMARPDAERLLVVAFGMGTSYRTGLAAGLQTDAVELVPSVVDMFHWYYDDAEEMLADPRGRVIVADGRNHVELADDTYDLIIVDPPPPIESAGVSVISSLGFYEASKERLTPGGVMMQWVPFGQSLDEFLAHIRTFQHAFANVRVHAGPGGYGHFMLGSDGPVDLDPATMRAVLERPGVYEDVMEAPDARGRTIDDWVNLLLAGEIASGDQVPQLVGDGPLITDNRPLPEYFLVRNLTERDREWLTRDSLQRLRAERLGGS